MNDEKKAKILVIGSFVMDLVVTTSRFPEPGETVLGTEFSMATGGKGANQAIQAARLGASVDMIGSVGNDANGAQLLASAAESGVDISRVKKSDDAPSAIGNIQIEHRLNGTVQNRIIVVSGANMKLNVEDMDLLPDIISNYDMLVLQLEIPMDVNCAAARFAKEAGVTVVLNPAPAAAIPDELLKCVDYLIPNETEASLLSGIEIKRDGGGIDMDGVISAAEALRKKGVSSVVITLGDAGSIRLNNEGLIKVPCTKVDCVVDPTAAGDSYIGAFCTAKASGMKDYEAMSFAGRVAAITVSRFGAQPSLPNLNDLEGFILEREQVNEYPHKCT